MEAKDTKGTRPLMNAVLFNRIECLEIMLNKTVNYDARNIDGLSAAHIACELGNSECLNLLLQVNCNKNAITRRGETPLIIAAQNGHTTCLKILISRDANLEARKWYARPRHTLCPVMNRETDFD